MKPDIDTLSRDRLDAVHEAGHAVVAHQLNGLVYLAALHTPAEVDGRGYCSHAGIQDPFDLLTVTWGGIAATKVLFGVNDMPGGAGDDYPAAKALAAKLLPGGSEDDRARLQVEAIKAAQRIIRRHRAKVEAIARLLLRDGEANYKVLNRIFRRTTPRGRSNSIAPAPRRRKPRILRRTK